MDSSPALKSSLKDYSYDFVLATTQRSINATMKQYLNDIDMPLVLLMYATDPNEQDEDKAQAVSEITVDTLNARIAASDWATDFPNGIDLFSIPNKTDGKDKRIKALQEVGFEAAIRIRPGIPKQYDDPTAIPDIVTLSENTSAVSYRMFCKDFDVFQLVTVGPKRFWNVLSQAQNDKPWTFVAAVDMRMSAGSEFAKLPEPVQKAIKNLDDNMFSIQQLALDLDNAGLQSTPTIEGLESSSKAYDLVQRYFANKYLKDQHAKGTPVLNYTVKHKQQTATLAPTDLDFLSKPYLDDAGKIVPLSPMASLNYLCMTEGKPMPGSNRAFGWNWVAENEASQLDGMISINRNTFTKWFLSQIKPAARAQCFKPRVRMTPGAWTPDITVWREPLDENDLTITTPGSGSRVLEISWSKEDFDEAGASGALGSLRYRNTYNATVDFTGSKISVAIRGVVYMKLRITQNWQEANVVDKTYTADWTLGVDSLGLIQVNEQKNEYDNSQNDSINGFANLFTGANDIFQQLRNWNLSHIDFGMFPFRGLTDFVFPGGRSFAFKNLRFSNQQDLLCAITYTDPAGK